METVSTSLQLHRSGKLRLLGFGHASRAAIAPEIPTFAEAGLPGYEAYTFNLILAPAGTPPDIVDAVSQATRKVMSDKTTIKALEDIAAIPILNSTPASTAKFIVDEIAKWAPVIKATGVKIE
jgi:tripartite-type tricarboxylate transporter receptor subunit TctC